MIAPPHTLYGSIQGAFEFIFEPQRSNVTGGKLVGGFDQTVELALTQLQHAVARGIPAQAAIEDGVRRRGDADLRSRAAASKGRDRNESGTRVSWLPAVQGDFHAVLPKG